MLWVGQLQLVPFSSFFFQVHTTGASTADCQDLTRELPRTHWQFDPGLGYDCHGGFFPASEDNFDLFKLSIGCIYLL